MVALSEKISNPSSMVLLELLVARHAALLIEEVALDNSSLEGDSKNNHQCLLFLVS